MDYIKVINLILENPANNLNITSRDLLETMILALKLENKSTNVSLITDCPLCKCSLTELIEDSTEIRECQKCGAEWEQSTGDITLNPNEL